MKFQNDLVNISDTLHVFLLVMFYGLYQYLNRPSNRPPFGRICSNANPKESVLRVEGRSGKPDEPDFLVLRFFFREIC